MSKQEETPFLDQDRHDAHSPRDTYFSEAIDTHHTKTWSLGYKISLLANFLLLIVCFSLVGTFILRLPELQTLSGASSDKLVELYSPANAAIEYQYSSIIPNDTRFTGHPGPKWEQSMHELMDSTLIRISAAELRQSGSDSIPLKDGGYAAGLGVGHNLHCIQFLYREHFYPSLDDDQAQFDYLQAHADHCLDFLRQGMLCHLDYSLYTLYWGERRQDIPTHRIPPVQKCVNWDKLQSWMRQRVASTDMLVRP
ncbi:hypothetical protein B0T17DRAFT_545559 [Bombardia bombarda]|uniref:Uncharacterized protein n=1 Tax=Bombardia bombarda TaxID=252184 RepID=A0AA39TJW2_9PEZI|nr:hypothetical protein B0T17DRAFT_545559 [Bombardia bombarda]